MAAGVRAALDVAAAGAARAPRSSGAARAATPRRPSTARRRTSWCGSSRRGGRRGALPAGQRGARRRATSTAAARSTVVVDPIDGSLNAKRGLPFYCLSVAVADGRTIGDVRFGAVLRPDRRRGLGRRRGRRRDGWPDATLGGEQPRDPFEVVLLEATISARRVGAAAAALDGHCSRVRLLGLARALAVPARRRAGRRAWRPWPARARSTSRPRSSIVREAGFAVVAPGEPEGGLDAHAARPRAPRCTVYAARDEAAAQRLAGLLGRYHAGVTSPRRHPARPWAASSTPSSAATS